MELISGLTHAGRHIVDALVRRHDDGRQWATRYDLAREAKVSPRHALRVLARLEESGALEVQSVREQQYGINTPTLYRLTVAAATALREGAVNA